MKQKTVRLVWFCLLFLIPLLLPAEGVRYILFEDFDSASGGAMPAGWTILDANLDGVKWDAKDLGGYANGICVRYLSAPIAADDWLFSPAVHLTSGVSYTLFFNYRTTSAALPHRLDARLGASPVPPSMTTLLLNMNSIANVDIADASAPFTVGSTGLNHLGFRCMSNPSNLALFLDNIGISAEETDLEVVLQMDKTFYENGANTYTPSEEKKSLIYVENKGITPVKVNQYFSIGDSNDMAALLSFEVRDGGGNLVPYQGREKKGEPEESDFVTLAKGQSICKYFDFNSGFFNFKTAGNYTIRAIYRNVFPSSAGDAWRGRLISAPVVIQIH